MRMENQSQSLLNKPLYRLMLSSLLRLEVQNGTMLVVD